MKLKIIILSLSLIISNCVFFTKTAEVSQIKMDIVLEGSEAEKAYEQVCKEYINFEKILNEFLEKNYIEDMNDKKVKKIDPKDIERILVTKNWGMDFSTKDIMGTFHVKFEQKGETKYAISIVYSHNFVMDLT